MSSYIILDYANTTKRARINALKAPRQYKAGLSVHIALQSIMTCYANFNGGHLVCAIDGHSWRYSEFSEYKANRDRSIPTDPLEKDALARQERAYADMLSHIHRNTNATMLYSEYCEADDMIAGFIQAHPDNNHVILSNDSDFHQLIAENVAMYDEYKSHLVTYQGIFNQEGEKVDDLGDIQYNLFKKIVRGDKSDNIPAIAKRISEKILQNWYENGIPTEYEDEFKRNQALIDLNQQPEAIKQEINRKIQGISAKNIKEITNKFRGFCGKWQLKEHLQNEALWTEIFNSAGIDK